VYANGHVLFVREHSLVAQPFDPDALELGDAFPVAEAVQHNRARSRGIFSASANGVLAYQAGAGEEARMVWLDRRGSVVGPLARRAPSFFCTVSPRGDHVAFDDYDPESRNTDIWVHDLQRDVTTRFTFDAATDVVPLWMKDGERILFSSNRHGKFEVFERRQAERRRRSSC